jgi:hypothetical protein
MQQMANKLQRKQQSYDQDQGTQGSKKQALEQGGGPPCCVQDQTSYFAIAQCGSTYRPGLK